MRNLIKILAGVSVICFIYFMITGSNVKETHSIGSVILSKPSTIAPRDFRSVIFNDEYRDWSGVKWVTYNFQKYDSLNFTGLQFYENTGGNHRYGTFGDTLNPNHIDSIKGLMEYIRDTNMTGVYTRSKIYTLCFGERLIYEAEGDNNGFSYSTHPTAVTDSGRSVVYKSTSSSGADWMCTDITENVQHSDLIYPAEDIGRWFLKPVMRINQADATGPSKPVFKVVVTAFNSDTIARFTVKTENFVSPTSGYSGQYIDSYFGLLTNELTVLGDESSLGLNKGRDPEHLHTSKVDFKIYWLGQVNVWFDKLIVDNDKANRIFNGDFDDEIADEVTVTGGIDSKNTYYFDETSYSNIECIKYVAHKIDSINPDASLSFVIANSQQHYNLRNPLVFHRAALTQIQPKILFVDPYVIPNDVPDVFGGSPSPFPNAILRTTTVYNDSLQYKLGDKNAGNTGDRYGGSFIYQIHIADTSITNSNTGSKLYVIPQMYGYMQRNNAGGNFTQSDKFPREPMNEEIEVQAMISIAHGADGLGWFIYQGSVGSTPIPSSTPPGVLSNTEILNGTINAGEESPDGYTTYLYGLLNFENTNRTVNVYGKDKWNFFRAMNQKIKNWKPTLDKINWTGGYSVHSEGASHSNIIYDIQSIVPGTTGQNPCTNDYQTSGYPTGPYMDCPEERYWEMGFFTPADNTDKAKYFMMVNRRCIPTTSNYAGDLRQLKIKFDADYLPNFANWNVIDINTNAVVATVNKHSGSYYNFDVFQPGEGRLYKIVPTLIIGGVLETNENLSDVEFDCDSSVTATNKKITIGAGVNISFKNNARIKLSGGNFICGTVSEAYNAPKSVNLQAQSGMKWGGIVLENMDTVHIQNTEVKDIDSDSSNHGYGISLVNSKVINIDNCNVFNTSSTAAGIQVNYITNLYMNPDINITGNTIKISTDTCSGIYIHPYSWLTLTPYIYGNKIINTSSGGGETGIFGFSLEGTAVKNNYVENFRYGMMTWYSSLDLFENTIDTKNITNGWDLYGIVSEYNLSNAYESRLGGSNVLTTLDGRNICLDALDLNLTDGNNIFNINDEDGYHLAGYFPMPLPSGIDPPPTNAMGNCFQIEGIPVSDESYIRKYVTWYDLAGMAFDFSNPICPESPNYCDYYIGGNPNDTVWIECGGGMGGGQKDNYELRVTNYKLSEPQENVYKNIYDSLSINMRKKQYELAAQKCITLLDNYTDSTKTINAVDKLYHTALARDEVSELKSYFESFIQSHPNNTQIIQRMFYYIQKAKAKLGQYESAMQGFQTIMNQFPTSYEGLAAKWDYMATQLLDSLSGQGGSEKETISYEQLTDEQIHVRLVSLVEDPLDKYDKKKFTKEDRKVIVTNIVNSFEDRKIKETKKFKELETKVIMNEASKSEKQEYKTKKVLKEVVRPQTVNTISEHINAVQSDIVKVFSVGKNTKDVDNKTIAVIPLEYKLNQNYPNPFNPTTKINYELKNAGYVSLKIYDLLGREIAELVNETKDAGRYTIDFNANKYMMASGIYFYRIKAGDFVDTKRMVLIK